MPTGAYDANGVWQYGNGDTTGPFHTLLNKLAASVSTSIGSLKSRATALENASKLSAGGSPFVAASGWTVVSQSGYKKSGLAFVYVRATRTGAAITVPVDGNIVNQTIATVAAGWTPQIGPTPVLQTAHTGRLAAGYIDSAGLLWVSTVAPGSSIATGEDLTLVGCYPI